MKILANSQGKAYLTTGGKALISPGGGDTPDESGELTLTNGASGYAIWKRYGGVYEWDYDIILPAISSYQNIYIAEPLYNQVRIPIDTNLTVGSQNYPYGIVMWRQGFSIYCRAYSLSAGTRILGHGYGCDVGQQLPFTLDTRYISSGYTLMCGKSNGYFSIYASLTVKSGYNGEVIGNFPKPERSVKIPVTMDGSSTLAFMIINADGSVAFPASCSGKIIFGVGSYRIQTEETA